MTAKPLGATLSTSFPLPVLNRFNINQLKADGFNIG
jgi:hypothetical protein